MRRTFKRVAMALSACLLLMTAACSPAPVEGSGSGAAGQGTAVAEPTTTTRPFMEGTVEENTVVCIDSGLPGPCVYIVGGIHGDELAGWQAAERLKTELQPTCGKVYILSPVNRSGAAAETRFVVNSGDMNRVFPGDHNSKDMATRIAAALTDEIKRTEPDLILDLHEAKFELGTGSTYAGLANTLIFTDDSKIAEMLFDFTLANEAGLLLDRTFALTSPGITGSFNRVTTDQLGFPVITTETWRKLDLEHRIEQQLDIVHFCLEYYGMIDPNT